MATTNPTDDSEKATWKQERENNVTVTLPESVWLSLTADLNVYRIHERKAGRTGNARLANQAAGEICRQVREQAVAPETWDSFGGQPLDEIEPPRNL